MYASIIDAVPEGASSGLVAAPVAGILIQNFGFAVHYVVIAAIFLLALDPISMIRETATLDRE